MAFKDAFKDIVDMFDNPKVGNVVNALAQAQRPPQQSVAGNLSVPFGATFEQGAALRGEAQQADQFAAARAAAEKAGQAEAQRVALEGRRVTEGEKQGEHTRAKDDLSESEYLQKQDDNALNQQSMRLSAEETMNENNNTAAMERITATYAKQDLNNENAFDREEDSPYRKAQTANLEASTTQSKAQTAKLEWETAALEAAGITGDLYGFTKEARKAGVPDADIALEWINAFPSVLKTHERQLDASADPDKLFNMLGLQHYAVGYELGALPVSIFSEFLSAADFAQMQEMDKVWRAAQLGDMEPYMQMRAMLNDAKDDANLNRSSYGSGTFAQGNGGRGRGMLNTSAPQPATPAGSPSAVETAPPQDYTKPAPVAAGATEPHSYVREDVYPGMPGNMTPSYYKMQHAEKLEESKRQDRLRRAGKGVLDTLSNDVSLMR